MAEEAKKEAGEKEKVKFNWRHPIDSLLGKADEALTDYAQKKVDVLVDAAAKKAEEKGDAYIAKKTEQIEGKVKGTVDGVLGQGAYDEIAGATKQGDSKPAVDANATTASTQQPSATTPQPAVTATQASSIPSTEKPSLMSVLGSRIKKALGFDDSNNQSPSAEGGGGGLLSMLKGGLGPLALLALPLMGLLALPIMGMMALPVIGIGLALWGVSKVIGGFFGGGNSQDQEESPGIFSRLWGGIKGAGVGYALTKLAQWMGLKVGGGTEALDTAAGFAKGALVGSDNAVGTVTKYTGAALAAQGAYQSLTGNQDAFSQLILPVIANFGMWMLDKKPAPRMVPAGPEPSFG